jgi:hypothetical protein
MKCKILSPSCRPAGLTRFQDPAAFSVTDPASWAEHRPISEYRHAGNFPCRSNVARGSPRPFTDKLLTGSRQSARNPVFHFPQCYF